MGMLACGGLLLVVQYPQASSLVLPCAFVVAATFHLEKPLTLPTSWLEEVGRSPIDYMGDKTIKWSPSSHFSASLPSVEFS